ncbi:Erythromycin esterase [Bacillus pseudomycoides]|nr:Erythromycin esterase [Bacillus pseudomycoides]
MKKWVMMCLRLNQALRKQMPLYQNIDDLTARQAMKKAISNVWSTEDVEELFQYIKEQKEKGTPLILTGFDIQIPWDASTATFAIFANEWIGKLNPEIGKLLVEAEKEIVKYRSVSTYEKFQAMQAPLLDKYERIKEFIQKHKNQLQQVAPKASYDVNLLEKLIKIRIDTLKTYIPNQVKEELSIPPQPVFSDFSYYSHDKQMGQNLAWLSELQYKNKKMIVWGHNYHIRKQNAKMLKADPYPIPFPNMMDVMPKYLKDQMYSVGLYAYSGSSLGSNNNGPFPVNEKHAANSIEEILKSAQHPQLKGEENRPENSWMYMPIIGLHWGQKEEIMIPNQQYDGILWLEHITPSQIK